nr:PREDICTED: echinoderm microtubule-associated protein-like CG42247 [Linepithema humile]
MIETENQLGSHTDKVEQNEEKETTAVGDHNESEKEAGNTTTTTILNNVATMKKEEQEVLQTREDSPKGGTASIATPMAISAIPVDDIEDEEDEEEEEENVEGEEEEEERDEKGGIAVEGVMTTMPPPEQSEQSSRPKSRHEPQGARYNNLGYWRARRVTFYKNGDPYFPGIEFRFKPGRDIGSLEALLDRLSLRLDLPRGARHIFSMDGDRKISLDELEDGASYVVSSYKTFKPASYGKKNNTWYTNPTGGGGSRSGITGTGSGIGGWQSRPPAMPNLSRKASVTEEVPPPGGGKPSSGRVIRIVNNHDHTVQVKILELLHNYYI